MYKMKLAKLICHAAVLQFHHSKIPESFLCPESLQASFPGINTPCPLILRTLKTNAEKILWEAAFNPQSNVREPTVLRAANRIIIAQHGQTIKNGKCTVFSVNT